MTGKSALGLGFLIGLTLAGCESRPSAPEEPNEQSSSATVETEPTPRAALSGEIVARYGEKVVGADELVRALQRLPNRSLQAMGEQARRQFVENHVLNELLFEEGKARGFDQDPKVREQVRGLERKLVVQKLIQELQAAPPISEESIAAYYRDNESSYSTTTLRARHILVRQEDLATEILSEIEADPGRFAEFAKEHSIDTASARKGGDLGFFGHGRMVPPFEAAAFALQEPGDLSELVKTQYGYHIILLEERREGAQRPLDQVRERIRSTLRQQGVRTRTQRYYDELKAKANLEMDEAAVARILSDLPKADRSGPGLDVHRPGGH